MRANGRLRFALQSTILAFGLNLLVHAGAAAATCESLASFTGRVPGTTVSSAAVVARGSKLVPVGIAPSNAPYLDSVDTSFCRVVLVIPRAINVEVWLPLPDAWNGKFQGVGNGGMNGLISYSALSAGVKRGYATVSSDLGHSSGSFDARWAADDAAAVVDWGHRATHEMTVAAKALVDAFYGKAPRLSYFTGCSGGGRQGLMEAQRYPADYDGIVAGAPTSAFTRLVAGGRLWVTVALLR
jgi:feruloyl esterase